MLGTVIVPGAALVDLALHAAAHTGFTTLDELLIEAPLTLTEPVRLQVAVTGDAVPIHSRTDGDWTLHATGTLSNDEVPPTSLTWPPNAREIDVDEMYAALGASGLQYGPAFRNVTAAWRSDSAVYAEVSVQDHDFGVHPALLDAALHPFAAVQDDRRTAVRLAGRAATCVGRHGVACPDRPGHECRARDVARRHARAHGVVVAHAARVEQTNSPCAQMACGKHCGFLSVRPRCRTG